MSGRHRAAARHHGPTERDRGAASGLELVILAPVLVVVLLLVVALGRYAHARQLVEQAAAAAARAATLVSGPAVAGSAARAAAVRSLGDAGVSCGQVAVDADTSGFRPGGVVAVRVSCTADLADLTVAGVPGSATVSAEGRAPLETYRQYDATGSVR